MPKKLGKMTENQKKKLAVFENRVRKLMYLCDALKDENIALKQQISEKEKALQTANNTISEITTQYDNLKIARVVSINQGEIKNAKQKLSKLVREVDRCIALLNE